MREYYLSRIIEWMVINKEPLSTSVIRKELMVKERYVRYILLAAENLPHLIKVGNNPNKPLEKALTMNPVLPEEMSTLSKIELVSTIVFQIRMQLSIVRGRTNQFNKRVHHKI